MARILVTASKHDLPTEYLSAYAQVLVNFAYDQGHQVTPLIAEDATFAKFEAEMQHNPDVVIIAGHGNTSLVTGQDLEPLIQVGVNDDVMANKIAYLWACLTGITLGPNMVAKGCSEYYGYQADFTFIYHPTTYEHGELLNDAWAQPFFDSAKVTGEAILLGLSAKDVYEKTVERYNYWWDWWLQQNDPVADDIMTWLNWDRHNFIAITPQGIYLEEKATRGLIPVAIPLAFASLIFLIASDKSKEK